MGIIKRLMKASIKKAKSSGFSLLKDQGDGAAFRKNGMLVIFSISKERDKKTWIHLSASFIDRSPNYKELCELKSIFIGKEKKAIMVFPPEKEHVNIHPYCLHLWCCLDRDSLPDFRKIPGII